MTDYMFSGRANDSRKKYLEDENEKNFLYLLTERRLRTVLTFMYNSMIGSNENAVLVEKFDPSEIDPTRFGGTELTRISMAELCDWLEQIKLFTKNEGIYNAQFLEPVRIISKLIQSFRIMKKRTTEIEGWVFSSSKPYQDMAGEKRVTLSMVVPKLQTGMTIRVSDEEARKIGHGYFVFGRSQPVPLVNRLHQATPTNFASDKVVRLSEFDFLFTSFDDIEVLKRSVEMENFCEVESSQSEVKQHLGCPFVSFGRVASVRPPNIFLKNLRGDKVIKLQISHHFYKNNKETNLAKLEGRTVRFFGVQWYGARSKNDIKFEMPELFHIEQDDNSGNLVNDEMCGVVRLRGKASVSELEKTFGCKMVVSGCLKADGDLISFNFATSDEPIISNFLESISKIWLNRQDLKTIAVQVTEDQVIDKNKMKTEGLASLLRSSKHRILYEILLDYLLQMDRVGEYDMDNTISTIKNWPEDLIKRKIYFMKYLGIFEKTNTGFKITKSGTKVAFISISRDLKARFSSLNERIISLKDIELEGIPPSIVLTYLRKGNVGGYKPIKFEGVETEMYWSLESKISGNDYERLVLEYSNLRNEVLDIMRSVSYPLTSKKIVEKMSRRGTKVSDLVVRLLLEETTKSQRVRPIDESWEYTLAGRVFDLFETQPKKNFGLDRVLQEIHVGTILKGDVKEILDELVLRKVLEKLNVGWTLNKEIDEKKNCIMKAMIRNAVKSLLEKRRTMDIGMLSGYVEGVLVKTNYCKSSEERKKLIKKELMSMNDEGLVLFSENMVSKS